MSSLIKECVDKLCGSVATVAQNEGKINAKLYYLCQFDIDYKFFNVLINHRTFSTFTMDVIARCAFGLKIDNLGDKDDPFIRNATFIFNPPTLKSPIILLPCIIFLDEVYVYQKTNLISFIIICY